MCTIPTPVPQIMAVLLVTLPQLVPSGIPQAQDALKRFSEGRGSWSLHLRHIHTRGTGEVDPPPALPEHPEIMDLSQPWH